MKTLQKYTKKWGLSAGLWKSVTLAVICLSALSMWNCRGIKQFADSRISTSDSLTDRTTVSVQTLKVPRTQAVLRLAPAEVQALPPGAVFAGRNGQASLQVERRDSLIVVTATCDSLQLLAESQTREIYRLRTQMQQQATVTEKQTSRWEAFRNNCFYIAVGMVIMTVINFIRRIWQTRPTSRWRL